MNEKLGLEEQNLRVTLRLIGGFNLIDYYCTGRAVGLGCPELNPLVASLLPSSGFPLFKLGLVNLCLAFIWWQRPAWRRIRRLVFRLLQATGAAYLAVVLYHGYGLF